MTPDRQTHVLRLLRQRAWIIIAIILAGTGASAIAGSQIIPTYTAKALLSIRPPQMRIVDLGVSDDSLSAADPATMETHVRILLSPDNIQHVADDLDLWNDPEYRPKPDLAAASIWDKLTAWVSSTWLIATGLAKEHLSAVPNRIDNASTARFEVERYILEKIQRQLTVSQEGRSYVIGVNFTSTNPDKAAQIANRLAEIFIERQIEARRLATERAWQWLGDRLGGLREDVVKSDTAVQRFRAENNLADARKTDLVDQQLADISRELVATQAELAEREARVAFVRRLTQTGEGLDSLPEVMSSPVIIELRRQESELSRAEAELRGTFGGKHPRLTVVIAEQKKLDDKINGEIRRIALNVENEVSKAQARSNALQHQLDAARNISGRNQEADIRLRELERQATATRQLYETFLQRFKEAREEMTISESKAEILSAATRPFEPSSPGAKLFAVLGFTTSGIAGVLVVLLADRMRTKLRSEDDTLKVLDLRCHSLVPRLPRRVQRRPHRYLLEKPGSAYAESIRAVFVALHRNTSSRLVLITSSVPNEGKTTFAVSLAVCAGQMGIRVLLVDLDLHRPSVSGMLGLRPGNDMVYHLQHGTPLDHVVVDLPDLRISCLTSMYGRADAASLLMDQRIAEALRSLSCHYDLVVIDSPPVLGIVDASLLARMSDETLFVVRWDNTKHAVAQNAVAALRRAGANLTGVVISQVNLKRHVIYGYEDAAYFYQTYKRYYVEQ